MEHFATHKLSKTSTSLPSKVSDSIHCGSVSWITNGSGTPVQHLQYMPYGEPLVNERTSSYEERFTFTGKERDSETGFSYFGARYYDSDLMTGWLSVDPLADKYPNISPYAYCAWNPVKLVDPDGEEIVFEDNKAKILFEQVYNNVKNRMSELKNNGLKKKRDIREYEQLKEIYTSLNDVKESSIVFYYKTIDNKDDNLAGGKTYGKNNIDGI
ncbi:MAG: RHS repeat-associated core domain-containing protein, partial [Bacteroidales bacterium]|nr:RHS repeat-associated core domain-containing protein [Bacteroidales bacterium]